MFHRLPTQISWAVETAEKFIYTILSLTYSLKIGVIIACSLNNISIENIIEKLYA
ncbi:MAG: hypothetical protein HQM08_23710 [Candidatus Riflebacteria bacterium]|nr:hypothetical protein [Candidatus Riflebacteria bacterium]